METLKKSNSLSEIVEHWIENYFHLVFKTGVHKFSHLKIIGARWDEIKGLSITRIHKY